MNNIGVGSTIWRFYQNHRVYDRTVIPARLIRSWCWRECKTPTRYTVRRFCFDELLSDGTAVYREDVS